MKNKLFVFGVSAASLLLLQACDGAMNGTESSVSAGAIETVSQVPQLLSAEKIAIYKRAAPKVAFGKLQAIIDDPDTLWYDQDVMPSSYQDSVAPDVTVGCRPNNEGANLINIIPGGRQVFSPDGKTFAFPFAHTQGIDHSTNTEVVNFMSLPLVEGKRLPVVYTIKNGNRGGVGLRQWRWLYPKGTVFGELIMIKNSDGERFPVELRTRERYLSGWATNAYRPYPTATALADAVKSRRPTWESNETLRRLVDYLGDSSTLTSKKVGSKFFKGVFDKEGALDTMPDIGDANLVADLLQKPTFVSAFGATWKSGNGLKTFAASTASSFSIVPNAFEAGMIEVRDKSCTSCHQDAQRPINDFNSQALLYGDVWGSDQIFSFHPFDPKICHGAAEDNRAVRPIFKSSGLVQKYDPSVHTETFYKELP